MNGRVWWDTEAPRWPQHVADFRVQCSRGRLHEDGLGDAPTSESYARPVTGGVRSCRKDAEQGKLSVLPRALADVPRDVPNAG